MSEKTIIKLALIAMICILGCSGMMTYKNVVIARTVKAGMLSGYTPTQVSCVIREFHITNHEDSLKYGCELPVAK